MRRPRSNARRRWQPPFALAFLLVLAAPALAQAPVSDTLLYVELRQPVPTEDNLTGYLTWNSGVGGIAWEPDAKSEDLAARPADDSYKRRAGMGWTEYTRTGSDAGIPTDVFTSAPFPRTIYLNVSRPVELNLYTNAPLNACPQYQVELWAGTAFVGGQIAARLGSNSPLMPRPPPGFCLFFARIHPEVDRIEGGAELTLRLLFREGKGPASFGTAGDHASILRFAYYGPVDALYRIPELGADEIAGLSPSSALEMLPVLPVLPLLTLLRRGRNAAAAVVLALLLAGCVATPGTQEGVAPEVSQDSLARKTVLPGKGHDLSSHGALLGQVSSDLRRPLGRAHVVLLHTENFTQTNDDGRYEFPRLDSGLYRIRVDRTGFVSYESDVEVLAGNVTRLDIMLVRPGAGKGGLKAHFHDDWGGKSKITVMDDDVHFVFKNQANRNDFELGSTGTCHGVSPQLSVPGRSVCRVDFVLPSQADGSAARIIPGTYDVVFTLNWAKTQVPVHKVGIGVRHLADPGPMTAFYPRDALVPIHVRANWEMSDVGHQDFSQWAFFFYVPTNSGKGTGSGPGTIPNEIETTGGGVQVLQSPVHVKIEIVKGIVPLEPGHRDFWGTKDRLTVINATSMTTDKACNTSSGATTCTFPSRDLSWTPESLVPPGTAFLEAILSQDKAGTPAHNWNLIYRPANTRPPATAYSTPSTDFNQHKPMPTPTITPEGKAYRLALRPNETDPFYAKLSNWNFAVDDGTSDEVAMTESITFTLTVIAHRDPNFDTTAE